MPSSHNAGKLAGQGGYSLTELTIIVLILSIMAAATVPFFYGTSSEQLEAAVDVQTEAIRCARAEAQRRGTPIGFRQQNVQKRMRVFSVDTSGSPWTAVYDVYHPVSKKLWDISLDEHPYAEADLVDTTKVFRGTCNTPSNIYFDANGIARCTDPETIPSACPLKTIIVPKYDMSEIRSWAIVGSTPLCFLNS